ncbi:MAG: hypothetical protein IJX77_05185 [Ruminococcus sp.]|nr:hypothetical protein [Ruminococcus sp.]
MKNFPEKKSAQTLTKKKSPLMTAAKAVLIILTVIFSAAMVILSGSGLIYNADSYGRELVRVGYMLILSGVLLTLGAALVCFGKNIAALICSVPGFALCMFMLRKLTGHADNAGWTDNFSMEPISSMYLTRILPVIAPFVLTVVIALVQYFSYEESMKRREKKCLKEEKENEPAPPII